MSALGKSAPSAARRTGLLLTAAALIGLAMSAPAFARGGHLGGGGHGGGGHGGGNMGSHFSGGGHHGGGISRPGGGGGGIHHPIPPPPHPHPHPGPGPHPHPPGPHPLPPHPYPHPWVPGALVWGAAIADDMWDDLDVVYALPGSCEIVTVGGNKYAHCGGDWYQKVFHGSQVAYVEVPAPR
jgi:hypothetical protein